MMPTKSITSNQTVRIAELAAVSARNATYNALEQILLDSETAQEKIITNGGEFQALISSGLTSLIVSALNKLSDRKHPQAELLEQYFREVLGYTLDLSSVQFPEKEGFTSYMAVPHGLDEDEIMKRLTSHFKINPYSYMSPIAANINRNVEQKRPQGLYVFAHRDGDEPDEQHLGKSYDDAMTANMVFLNPKEYLLATGFHQWQKGVWMDAKGWTRTSSLWSDGRLVCGFWLPDDSSLDLGYGYRDRHCADGGPRELVLAT